MQPPDRFCLERFATLAAKKPVLVAFDGPARTWSAYLAGGLAVALQLGHRVLQPTMPEFLLRLQETI
jgi:hypothetical protein